MNRRITSYGVIALMGVAGVVLARTTVYAIVGVPEVEVGPTMSVATTTSDQEVPQHISVPTISLDASIEKRGVVAGNRMAMPTSFSTVGWYEYGPAPGQKGTAVLYGHLNNGLGLSGVFEHLAHVKPGDEITITARDGSVTRFVVDRTETYPYTRVPQTAIASDPHEGAHLTLITCAGSWTYDAEEGMTYDHRLVVYATYQGTS